MVLQTHLRRCCIPEGPLQASPSSMHPGGSALLSWTRSRPAGRWSCGAERGLTRWMPCSSAHKVRFLFCCPDTVERHFGFPEATWLTCQSINRNAFVHCGLQGMLWGPSSMHGVPH